MLVETLERTGISADLALEDNPDFHLYRWATGDEHILAVAGSLLRCPTLPWPMRWRAAARTLLHRCEPGLQPSGRRDTRFSICASSRKMTGRGERRSE